ncbi:DUF1338 domain-containing protein [Synechococcus sp. PCC 7336]|uniref:DUF1338 domain-containing protein n=1 Tax=Synechococcus sp. PCC 7336 TaxID=195250 RepID=UPI000344D2A7|nr:DUF1338 domain-containing protein [Synechococcus sp. PCC 7336]
MKRIQIALQLWERLWQTYLGRVPYARIYQQTIEAAGGAIANDHIAFRSLRLDTETPHGAIDLGILYLAWMFESLGYEVAGEYEFPDRHLYARHYLHPERDRFALPKLFISELLVDELPSPIVQSIYQSVRSGHFADVQTLKQTIETASNDFAIQQTADRLQTVFTRPWNPPLRSVVEAVNKVSQYGAWVLLHGYAVNHFTGYVNAQNTPHFPDIESTALALAERGVPMKVAIEGSWGSGLRQTATHAVIEMVSVRDDETGASMQIPWPYAYFEIAERNWVEVSPGQTELFEGFLGAQAQNLFEMTRKAM